ncbi:Sec-independent protein translocase protein TatB [Candidatus Pelagibacter sp.]|nr:Sec-independent protein translocase protein TatB [Candidatus Pelagibacter sp.]
MPTIGWFEILIVVVIAIIVIGPKDFPFMLKKAGSWIGTIKKYINNIQNEVADLELDNIQNPEPKIKDKENKKDNDKI